MFGDTGALDDFRADAERVMVHRTFNVPHQGLRGQIPPFVIRDVDRRDAVVLCDGIVVESGDGDVAPHHHVIGVERLDGPQRHVVVGAHQHLRAILGEQQDVGGAHAAGLMPVAGDVAVHAERQVVLPQSVAERLVPFLVVRRFLHAPEEGETGESLLGKAVDQMEHRLVVVHQNALHVGTVHDPVQRDDRIVGGRLAAEEFRGKLPVQSDAPAAHAGVHVLGTHPAGADQQVVGMRLGEVMDAMDHLKIKGAVEITEREQDRFAATRLQAPSGDVWVVPLLPADLQNHLPFLFSDVALSIERVGYRRRGDPGQPRDFLDSDHTPSMSRFMENAMGFTKVLCKIRPFCLKNLFHPVTVFWQKNSVPFRKHINQRYLQATENSVACPFQQHPLFLQTNKTSITFFIASPILFENYAYTP